MPTLLITIAALLLIIGVGMIFISIFITGILSANEPQPVKGGLLGSTIIGIIGLLIAVAGSLVGVSYGSRKVEGNLNGFLRRSYLNWLVILMICVLITFIICLGIDIGYNNNASFIPSQHNALVIAVLAYFFGLVFLAIGAGCILFINPRGGQKLYETTTTEQYRQGYNQPNYNNQQQYPQPNYNNQPNYQRRDENIRSDY
jgi:hypothetical protein